MSATLVCWALTNHLSDGLTSSREAYFRLWMFFYENTENFVGGLPGLPDDGSRQIISWILLGLA